MAQADDEKYRPQEIDDTEDRMGSIRELDFSERKDERRGRVGDERPDAEAEQDFSPERAAESGMSGGEALTESLHEDNVTMDDLSLDTLYGVPGARDAQDSAEDDGPADMNLREVDADEIAGGNGLDEAELAHVKPLDGKPWTDDDSNADGEHRHE